jgi:hypothetical protein
MALKIVKEGEQYQVFDPVRKKYVLLTPEEEVRQHLILYLNEQLQYPIGLMMVEKKIVVNKMTRRPDIVVYKEAMPYILIECKAPQVKLTQKMFEQVAQYNLHFGVPIIVLSNGSQSYVCRINKADNKIDYLEQIPGYLENI